MIEWVRVQMRFLIYLRKTPREKRSRDRKQTGCNSPLRVFKMTPDRQKNYWADTRVGLGFQQRFLIYSRNTTGEKLSLAKG